MRQYQLSEIAQKIDVPFEGKDCTITGIHTLKEATETQLSFLSDKKHLCDLANTKAVAVLIDARYIDNLPSTTLPLITSEPYLKLAYASKLFSHDMSIERGTPSLGVGCHIDKSVNFGKNVTIGKNTMIMAGCYIGDNVVVGSDTLLHPNVTLYHGTQMGSRCIIHSGTVIGCDGYGFAHTKMGEHIKIYQNGNVIVEDDVELGGNCSVDRAVFGSTYIRRGAKLDNLVHIAHNCDIGEHSLLAGQVGMAGSSILGRNVVMGGQSALAGHMTVEPFTTIAGKSGLTKRVPGGKTYAGFPAIEHKSWLRMQAILARMLKKQS